MKHADDRSYYSARTLEEIERGDKAGSPAIAAIHYELAYRYSILAARPIRQSPRLKLVHDRSVQLAA